MDLKGIEFKALERVPVQVSGGWTPGAGCDWRGTARSQQPLVGMSFLKSDGRCEWCKSERNESSPEMRLSLFPYDAAGVDVQGCFSVGHGDRRWRSLVPSASYRPKLLSSQELQTGRICEFATIEGAPVIELFVLFLVRSDVESSRKGLWRVRKRLEPTLDEPFRQWLTYGRTGASEA